jgi:3-hydroxyacyl-[acyl-carrier-protein] dehydratase
VQFLHRVGWSTDFGKPAPMPPQTLFDISKIDLDRVVFDQDAIRETNPQRGSMEHLNAIVYMDLEKGEAVGYKDVRKDEFWVPDHIPGRPLLPGVLMIEAAAQMASFVSRHMCGWKGFIGFGGADSIKFRAPVPPGVRLILLAKKKWERHGRLCCAAQGFVDGNLAFECEVIGTQI